MSAAAKRHSANTIWLQSSVAKWMRANHHDLAEFVANDEVDWHIVARTFRERGVFTGLGDLPSAAFLQDTWRQIDQAEAG
ncbi:hypothetical protein EJV46_14285 [Roseococcus sp. SYP-B2431]|uniref:hypothetical protein n=1 Tax=Roseococcus sp. SYP-B2431 TaxID=2496640 RepID=UPI00103B951F|nr:hypothetical protein [Roseococcus sp. SYP-B2431]TCH98341.1 hypothetical protein EJV46_14285 [Roseococcus sp. SYP-B2431]